MSDYSAEKDLVSDLVDGLCRVFDAGEHFIVGHEFYFRRGRTDVVAVADSREVFAFEAKLRKWRVALQQAYRNTCYAHRSYVVLPRVVAERAKRFEHEFHRRAVGLCSVGAGEVEVLIEARPVEPLEPWLTHEACALAESQVADAA